MKCVHQGALRLVERFRKMCKEAIEDDPLQPVAIIYEENLSKIKRDLGTAGVEPTEFEALVPNFLAMAPSLYRWFITGKTRKVLLLFIYQLEESHNSSYS